MKRFRTLKNGLQIVKTTKAPGKNVAYFVMNPKVDIIFLRAILRGKTGKVLIFKTEKAAEVAALKSTKNRRN